jgi:hypothetical protein
MNQKYQYAQDELYSPVFHKYFGQPNQLKHHIKLTRVKGSWNREGSTFTFTPKKGGYLSWDIMTKVIEIGGKWDAHAFSIVVRIFRTSSYY